MPRFLPEGTGAMFWGRITGVLSASPTGRAPLRYGAIREVSLVARQPQKVQLDSAANTAPDTLDRLPTLVPIRAVADKLGINDRTLYNYVKSGLIGSYKLGGLVMLDMDEVVAWLAASYRPPKQPD